MIPEERNLPRPSLENLKPLNFLNLDDKLSMIGFGKEFLGTN